MQSPSELQWTFPFLSQYRTKYLWKQAGTPAMPKFMQTLNDTMYRDLEKVAKQRGITVQELIRAVILPDWLSKEDHGKKH